MTKPKVLVDFHHSDLFRSWKMLFEKRLGFEVYRPKGQEWYDRGYYTHPIEAEGRGNLNPFNEFEGNWDDHPEYVSQDSVGFRWLSLDEAKDIDLIITSIDRNQTGFKKFRDEFGLKCKICRYTGNPVESFDFSCFNFMLAANLRYYKEFVESGGVHGMLFYPEFDEILHSYSDPITKETEDIGCPYPIVRSFINFLYHHPDHANHQNWDRYCRFLGMVGGTPLLHGLGTPPPGVETALDVILDIEFDRLNLQQYRYRESWPNRLTNRGEPSSETEVANLIRNSHIVFNQKHYDGYGFIPFKAASIGRPIICAPGDYDTLSAGFIFERDKTAIHITGSDEEDLAVLGKFSEPSFNLTVCREVRKRFEETVDFEDQARKVLEFL